MKINWLKTLLNIFAGFAAITGILFAIWIYSARVNFATKSLATELPDNPPPAHHK